MLPACVVNVRCEYTDPPVCSGCSGLIAAAFDPYDERDQRDCACACCKGPPRVVGAYDEREGVGEMGEAGSSRTKRGVSGMSCVASRPEGESGGTWL